MSSLMDGGDRQQLEKRAAPQPRLIAQVAGLLSRQQTRGRPRGRPHRRTSPGLYGRRDQCQTHKSQNHRGFFGVRLGFNPPSSDECVPVGQRKQKWACLASNERRCQRGMLSRHTQPPQQGLRSNYRQRTTSRMSLQLLAPGGEFRADLFSLIGAACTCVADFDHVRHATNIFYRYILYIYISYIYYTCSWYIYIRLICSSHIKCPDN